jgi:hypothetical protein
VSRHAQIPASMTVDRVSLIRSVLGGGPAKYEIAEDFFLR